MSMLQTLPQMCMIFLDFFHRCLFFYLSEAGCVDRLHGALAAEVDVVEVDDVSRNTDALGQLVIPLQPTQGRRGRMRP
jgi:hypothetical protein